MQSKSELRDGTVTIVHEEPGEYEDEDDFEVDLTPSSRRHSPRWIDAIETVVQRHSHVVTTAVDFRFDPSALPASVPKSSPMTTSSHTRLGIEFVADDHGRGAVLAGFSASRQLEHHNLAVGKCALLRVNKLEVVHLTHDRVVSLLEHAVRRAKRHINPKEPRRQVTLEFCGIEDYYQ